MSCHTARLRKYLTERAKQDWSERQNDINETLKELDEMREELESARVVVDIAQQMVDAPNVMELVNLLGPMQKALRGGRE
jgi:hypothetical protein